MRLVKKILGRVLQSHIIAISSKTWAGRRRKCRAPGWSGGCWQPPSPGGSSSAPARWMWSWWRLRTGSFTALEWWWVLWGGPRALWEDWIWAAGWDGESSAGSHTSTVEAENHDNSPWRLSIVNLFYFSHSNYVVVSHGYSLPWWLMMLSIFSCAYLPSIYLLCSKRLFRFFAVFIGLFTHCWLLRFSYIFCIQVLYQIYGLELFSPSI